MNNGAVIVAYNSESEIGPCLDAAIHRVTEVVVVDNSSTDKTCEEVLRRPAARLLANSCNRGFAGAVNQGVSAVRSPFVLLLNPDTVLLTSVEPLLEACTDGSVAVAAGKLVDEQGRPQAGFSVRRFPTPLSLSCEILGLNRLWPGNPVNRRFRCLDMDHDAPAEVEQPAGAFLMIRRETWEALGGFDESFHPLWFEDVDFLKRVREYGYRTMYVPQAVARHGGGHSVKRLPRECREAYWYASLLRYAAKHFRPLEMRAVCAAMVLGCLLRVVAGVLWERNLNLLRVYSKVIRLASIRLVHGRSGEADRSPILARH